ncbi:glucose-1-phosphate thymidylyltransferase [Candidatus Amarolinea aalborgensis]|jgi:NDP-sugar pyrophosphorylase family protein|uniref:acyltransferase n=1 Tax=Candidatus Amarolinea aalborgensis TaxID=2249329 RepID=UPI003BF9B2F8
MLGPHSFFELSDFAHAALFDNKAFVWEAIPGIGAYAQAQLADAYRPALLGVVAEGAYLVHPELIYLGEGSVIEPGAYVAGPCIIGRHCEIRHGAYLRGDVILGDHCVVGHASEVKNCIFLNGAHAPHFAYVGDSILGNRVNLGAGTKLSNLALTSLKDPATGKRTTIRLEVNGQMVDTGLAKMGAIMGDDAQTGCNSVLNPGCVIGPRTLIYANISLRKGYYLPDTIIKLDQALSMLPRM